MTAPRAALHSSLPIVCVSRGTFGGGKQLAEKLADKLGVPCIGREALTDAATGAGIAVGKLEMAVMRPRPLTEHLAVERDRFKAFVTATLAEKALAGGLVYHGRTGHLVLPSVPNVLRLRVILDAESRIALTTQRLGLDREKARHYNEQVDEDRRRWARALYNIDWDDPAHYDLVVNLDNVGADNAATVMVAVAQLPEFQPTPAAHRTLENLLLASRCRLALGNDPRTRLADVRIRAEGGRVAVTYHPRHEEAARSIPAILAAVEGVESVQCTMAATSILWIQERYDPASPVLGQLLEVAEKWNAAVGLVRLSPGSATKEPAADAPEPVGEPKLDAGILEDDPAATGDSDDAGVAATMSRLLEQGRAGGQVTVRGGPQDLVRSLDRTAACSLVVVGDVFLDKSESVRKRATRELSSYVAESLRVPVIGQNELEEHYLFGPKHWLYLFAYGAITVVTFWVVFHYQQQVLGFLTAPGLHRKALAVVFLSLFAPLFAAVYGGFSQYLLRLLKFE